MKKELIKFKFLILSIIVGIILLLYGLINGVFFFLEC